MAIDSVSSMPVRSLTSINFHNVTFSVCSGQAG
ncbi:hypothetical protein PICSAR103_04580 [Mycobacterium avium subsp. paratuberculosis]|nr:hypothetical protein PICSAR103_04580 [Mycobacterium avium subsp. paratuberculosis]